VDTFEGDVLVYDFDESLYPFVMEDDSPAVQHNLWGSDSMGSYEVWGFCAKLTIGLMSRYVQITGYEARPNGGKPLQDNGKDELVG